MNDVEEFNSYLVEIDRRNRLNKIRSYFPDEGPLRRGLYRKHLTFFKAGVRYRERAFIAANRVGKTESGGGYELVMHMTGLYPAWWPGRRFDRPVECWAGGDTGKTVRDILQLKLLGKVNEFGTGLVPQHLLGRTTPKSGIPDAVDTFYVRHVSGGWSECGFKSYDQRRESFQGTKKDVIWLDEECPLDIYVECVMRTADTSGTDLDNGLVMLTFTPLLGLSEVVLQFLPGGRIPEASVGRGSKALVMASWDDVPHLSEATKAELLGTIPPYQRDARTKGIPQLGSGAIYQVPETDVVVSPFEIPAHWPRGYSMDVGWNRTSAGLHVYDRETETIYRIGEHYRGQAEPSVHAAAVKAWGEWMEGVIDPAARGRSQVDGEQLLQMYIDQGLKLNLANNGVEAGIYQMWQRLSAGKYKVFSNCQNWRDEYRLYRRDEKGHIVKVNDHAMDESRYFVTTGLEHVKVKPVARLGNSGAEPGSWTS